MNYEVIDGQQRLRTFLDFMKDKFVLRGLQIRSELNDKKYSDLPQQEKDQIRKRSIRAILILNDSDEQLKYEVFERLNLKLTKDQDNMAYEEMVLRFFAYYKKKLKRVDNLATFLTKFMREEQDCASERIKYFTDLFTNTLKKIEEYLGEDAFNRPMLEKKKSSNRALYDAEMLAFSSIVDGTEKRSLVDPESFKSNLKNLLEAELEQSKDFRKSLNEQAGGKKIQERVE